MEPDDAWMTVEPLDQVVGLLSASPPPEPAHTRGKVGLTLHVKGLEAIFVADTGEEVIEAKFRYRRSAEAWQLYRRRGSRWVADGPPGARIGRLLEGIVQVILGRDATEIFADLV